MPELRQVTAEEDESSSTEWALRQFVRGVALLRSAGLNARTSRRGMYSADGPDKRKKLQ